MAKWCIWCNKKKEKKIFSSNSQIVYCLEADFSVFLWQFMCGHHSHNNNNNHNHKYIRSAGILIDRKEKKYISSLLFCNQFYCGIIIIIILKSNENGYCKSVFFWFQFCIHIKLLFVKTIIILFIHFFHYYCQKNKKKTKSFFNSIFNFQNSQKKKRKDCQYLYIVRDTKFFMFLND